MGNGLTRVFVSLPTFLLKWERLGLNDDDMRRLEKELLDNPKIGPVMRGTGKVRKMRFAFENRGKSGSVRVIYVDFEVYEKIYLVNAYQKSEKDNITSAEANDLRKLVKLLEESLEKNSGGGE